MRESQDVGQLLVRTLEMLRVQQEALFRNSIAVAAVVESLKTANPAFAAAYDKQYWELKQGRLGEENSTAVKIIEEIKRELHQAHVKDA